MAYEWRCIFGVAVLAGVMCSFLEAHQSAFFGMLSLSAGFLPFLGYVIASGIRARQHGKVPLDEARKLVLHHRDHVAALFAFILVGIVAIEVGIRKDAGGWTRDWLFLFHMGMVISMTVSLLVARFKLTGLRDAIDHRKVVYTFMGFYLVSLITGWFLYYERFGPALNWEIAISTPGIPESVPRLK